MSLSTVAKNATIFCAPALLLAACIPGWDRCTDDSDCASGDVCQDSRCQAPVPKDDEIVAACSQDSECQAIKAELVCSSSGLCDFPLGGEPCTTMADCDVQAFCNYQSRVCVPLQPGFCRQDSQCSEQKCSASPGGMGRCVQCLDSGDCDGATCLSNGVCSTESSCTPPCEAGQQCNMGQCVPVAGDCNPSCLAGEQCAQGVCYGDNGCPRHAHPVDSQCACDSGYVPSGSGNACVLEGSCDADRQQACQTQGGTWDAASCTCLSNGSCDPPCAPGSTCQGARCVPVTGACSTDMDCLTAASGFYTCDAPTSTCVCDAMQGILMCSIFGSPFDPDLCDCDWSGPGSGGLDAGLARDASTARDASPVDRGGGVDAGIDAGSASEDAAATDLGAARDAGVGDTRPGADAATGSGAPGDPCASDDDCSGYAAAWCVERWPGGYCGGRCDADQDNGECGSQGACICVDQGLLGCREAYCYKTCELASDCRAGYQCDTNPTATHRACVPL